MFKFLKGRISTMSSSTLDKPLSTDDHVPGATPEEVVAPGSAGFQVKYLARDIQAGIITGTMAVPLSIGIAMMSEYPIKVALASVVFSFFI
jgi:MFS superfamily sulfate permease-like transporter